MTKMVYFQPQHNATQTTEPVSKLTKIDACLKTWQPCLRTTVLHCWRNKNCAPAIVCQAWVAVRLCLRRTWFHRNKNMILLQNHCHHEHHDKISNIPKVDCSALNIHAGNCIEDHDTIQKLLHVKFLNILATRSDSDSKALVRGSDASAVCGSWRTQFFEMARIAWCPAKRCNSHDTLRTWLRRWKSESSPHWCRLKKWNHVCLQYRTICNQMFQGWT